jgi:HK97 family phage major capsid protein
MKFDKEKIVYRELSIEKRESIKEEDRTVELSFASEEPGEQYFGTEILQCTKEAVVMDRLRSGAALLLNHDREKQIGVVLEARIDGDKKARAVVKFSRGQLGEEVFQDVKDGIRSLVSVGYKINDMLEEKQDGNTIYRITSWEPYEISIVSIPMDQTVGVGRSEKKPLTEIELRKNQESKEQKPKEKFMETETKTEQKIDVVAERSSAAKGERERIAEISAIAEKAKVSDEIRSKAIRDGVSTEEFRKAAFDDMIARSKPVTPADGATIGLTEKDINRYSIVRAMNSLANDKPLEGLELECSVAVSKKMGKAPTGRGFFIPTDVTTTPMKRFLEASTFSAGGALVQTDVLLQDMISLLRNKTVVAQMGARVLSGLQGNIAVPKQTGGATAYWLAEGAAVTTSDQTFAQLALTPHRLSAMTAYTKQLLGQTGLSVEAFVRDDIARVLAIAFDSAAIQGAGGAEPLGILNTPGINQTVTFGGAAVWADVVQFETGIAVDNADIGTMGWVTTPAVRGKWKTIEKGTAGFPIFLWPDDGRPNGYDAMVTNNVEGDLVYFGVWSDLILAYWDGMEVTIDPYTLAASEQVRVIANMRGDVGVRHPLSFNVSTDSGAQ